MILGLIIGFWAIVYLLYALGGREWESIEVAPFQLIWRTRRFLDFIDRVGTSHARFWKAYGTLGVVVGFVGMIYVFYTLLTLAIKILRPKAEAMPGVVPVIPGVTIPLWYGLIALAVVMVVHELSHGFVARAEGLRLKSVGFILLFVIPGAFVEPDEEALNKAPLGSKLRVYAAGSMANILVAFLAALLMNAVALAFIPTGVEVQGVVASSPADGVLQKGDVIVAINGHSMERIEEFFEFMNSTRPGQTLELTVLRNGERLDLRITLGEHPEKPGKGYIGIYPAQHVRSKIGFDSILIALFSAFYWIYLLNFGIGLMNLFPIIPLDGGRMVDDILKALLPRTVARLLRYSIMAVGVLLLAINLIPALRGLLG
ncbi:site-2 protease family protein [Pyrococcus yayanosii]|uniref:Membrane-associated metalloprotease, M50 family, containing PDZ n=1 Tax=Pyrococcus yayanosii (strain CH1 / JCM 16557) TaxID=529709 RepID=F8AGT9_PYRYC|nr:Membrane-associated metalloprotease, M50 family, containing PDZ [Pyrococcus yayanosii CH1]